MRNIYKYIDKKYLFPIFLGRIVNSGLVLAQPLILTKALKLDQDGLSYGKILNFVLFGLHSLIFEKFEYVLVLTML